MISKRKLANLSIWMFSTSFTFHWNSPTNSPLLQFKITFVTFICNVAGIASPHSWSLFVIVSQNCDGFFRTNCWKTYAERIAEEYGWIPFQIPEQYVQISPRAVFIGSRFESRSEKLGLRLSLAFSIHGPTSLLTLGRQQLETGLTFIDFLTGPLSHVNQLESFKMITFRKR